MTQKPRERSASQSRNQSAVFLASPHMDWRPFPLLAGCSFVPPETSKSPAGAETGRSRRPHVNAGRKAGRKQAQWQEAHGEPGWRRRLAGQCADGRCSPNEPHRAGMRVRSQAGQATRASGHGRRQVPRPAFPDLSGIHQLERGYLNWTQHCAHSRK